MHCVKHAFLMLLSCIAFTSPVSAKWDDNLRLALDFSSRTLHKFEMSETAYIHAAGIDSHKVFTGKSGDWATFTGQVYLARIDNLTPRPGFFKDEHDWELTYRIFNINFTSLPGNLPNIKVGHIELPYGIEHTIDTNGTFRDYNLARNLGAKADWGVGINKQYENWEYEFTLTTGGGQSLDRGDDSYIAAGRIATNRDRNLILGLSLSQADLSGLERERATIDVQYFRGLWATFIELSTGSKGTTDQFDGLLEVNWRTPRENWFIYSQLLYFSEDRASGSNQDSTKLITGIRYFPNNKWDLSANLNHDIDQFDGAQEDTRFGVQARYRF
ncbi:hypothetical protein EYS14_23885 [Alteromonadaceae bacterium M269]|nr:hypothetical protein EYS14_23885 [Alteromonadaceae bacterium M269]